MARKEFRQGLDEGRLSGVGAADDHDKPLLRIHEIVDDTPLSNEILQSARHSLGGCVPRQCIGDMISLLSKIILEMAECRINTVRTPYETNPRLKIRRLPYELLPDQPEYRNEVCHINILSIHCVCEVVSHFSDPMSSLILSLLPQQFLHPQPVPHRKIPVAVVEHPVGLRGFPRCPEGRQIGRAHVSNPITT